MEILEILIEVTLVALVVLTGFTLGGTQHNAEGVENQEGEQGNNHDIEAGFQEGESAMNLSAPDEQAAAPRQLAQATNRHEETMHIEYPVVHDETEGPEEEQIGEVAPPRLDVQLPNLVTLQETQFEVHARVMKYGSKIGMWATGISVAGIIALLSSDDHNRRTSLCHTLLLVACTLAMLASFISGGILLTLAFFHVEIFPASDPKSTRKIKTVIGVALGSMAIVVSFVTALILQGAY